MSDKYDKLIQWLRDKIATDARFGQGTVDALTDVLTELEEIADRTSDLDARDRARSAMSAMTGIWITEDELDDLWVSWDTSFGLEVGE